MKSDIYFFFIFSLVILIHSICEIACAFNDLEVCFSTGLFVGIGLFKFTKYFVDKVYE